MTPRGSLFTPRAALVLVLGGVLLFAAMLWQAGGGLASGQINNGGTHAGGRGLNGFAGLTRLLASGGYDVTMARGKGDLTTPGLLVLSPPFDARGADLDRIVARHRRVGPVVVIAPKWLTTQMPPANPAAKTGWVTLQDTGLPAWEGFLDDVRVDMRHEGKGPRRIATTLSAPAPILPDGRRVEVGESTRLIPLADAAGHVLAARYDETITLPGDVRGDDRQAYPLYLVFEPDLIDNYGLSRPDNALWAEAFFAQAAGNGPRRITFDLTLNGLGRQPNLLTLAFMPPYLTATLVLGLAVLAAVWRGLLRFGPLVAQDRAIPLGKRSLLGNAAALVRRARRFHVLGAPYADAARGRLARALSLPRQSDTAAMDTAIDRALAARRGADPTIADQSFTATAAHLSRARTEREVLTLAQSLHDIERTLTP
jgi:hypothetical protein